LITLTLSLFYVKGLCVPKIRPQILSEGAKSFLPLTPPLFAREPTGFPARRVRRGGHWIFSGIFDKVGSSEIINILQFFPDFL